MPGDDVSDNEKEKLEEKWYGKYAKWFYNLLLKYKSVIGCILGVLGLVGTAYYGTKSLFKSAASNTKKSAEAAGAGEKIAPATKKKQLRNYLPGTFHTSLIQVMMQRGVSNKNYRNRSISINLKTLLLKPNLHNIREAQILIYQGQYYKGASGMLLLLRLQMAVLFSPQEALALEEEMQLHLNTNWKVLTRSQNAILPLPSPYIVTGLGILLYTGISFSTVLLIALCLWLDFRKHYRCSRILPRISPTKPLILEEFCINQLKVAMYPIISIIQSRRASI